MKAAVTERTQRLSGFLKEMALWHSSHSNSQIVIINALYGTYIAGRELFNIRSVC